MKELLRDYIQYDKMDDFSNLNGLIDNLLLSAILHKYYDDAKENVAFERCVDVVTALILKYGPAIKRKWILRDWIKNIQADCFWRSLACKRYQRYFDCMKAIVKNDTT